MLAHTVSRIHPELAECFHIVVPLSGNPPDDNQLIHSIPTVKLHLKMDLITICGFILTAINSSASLNPIGIKINIIFYLLLLLPH